MFKRNLQMGFVALAAMSFAWQAGAQNVEYKPVYSAQTGQVSYHIALPQDWQVHDPRGEVVISSPSGAKLYQSEIHSYFHSSNFGFQGQAMAERQYAEPVSAEQYFQQVIKPNMERGGARFVSSYPLPVYKDFFQKAADSLGSIRSRVRHDAIGSDWETQNGTKVMLVSVAKWKRRQLILMRRGKRFFWVFKTQN